MRDLVGAIDRACGIAPPRVTGPSLRTVTETHERVAVAYTYVDRLGISMSEANQAMQRLAKALGAWKPKSPPNRIEVSHRTISTGPH